MDKTLLGCFGKLPIHSDFIRLRASGEEIRSLDQWFQEGIHAVHSRWGRGWEAEFSKAEPWNFLFLPKGADGFLIGVFIPSHDQSGRRYPFFSFLRTERRSFKVPVMLSPAVYQGALLEMGGLVQSGWTGRTLREFRELVEHWAGPLPSDLQIEAHREAYRSYLERETSREFWSGLLGEFEHPRKYRIDQNLTEIIGPLRSHPAIPFGGGLKFPILAEGRGAGYDLAFWFDWVSRLLNREPEEFLWFWSRAGSAASCALAFFGPASPKGFAFFLRPQQQGEYWFDLAPRDGSDLNILKEKLRPERRVLLEEGNLSLGAFLARVGG